MGRYSSFVLMICFIAFLLSGCIQNSNDTDKTYHVKRVIDGDTIELANGMKVRYLGIDTPETRKKITGTWVYSPEEHAEAAKDFNRALVSGSNVRVEFDLEKEDKYGRWLAYVFTDNGIMANEDLLREGYALLYVFFPNMKFYDRLLKAQDEAILNKRGLWKDIDTILPGEAERNIGKIVIITGAVTDVRSLGYRGIEMRLSGNDNGSMDIMIPGKSLGVFEKLGIDPMGEYDGKNVEIWGKVRMDEGAYILLTSPGNIRIKRP